ncbi:MAG: nucleotidyltransferase domain-containing protein [Desulfomicrobium sp.]
MRFGLPEEAIQEIQNALALYPEVKKAILYGSRAMGTFKPGSDIDLTLVGEGLTHNHLLGIMSDLDDLLLPWMIDLSLYADLDHSGLREHIDRVGQTLYER